MRRDKATARILLILSIVHVVVASPVIARQRSLDIAKDVTPALEKRGNPDDESSNRLPQMNNDLPATFGIPPSPDDPPPTSETPPSQDDPPPESGTLQLHNDPPQTSGAPPSPDDSPPGSGIPQSSDDLPTTPGAPHSQHDRPPASGTPQLHNDSPPTSGAPSSHDDMPPASGHPQLLNDPHAGSEEPELHNDPSPWWLHTNWRPPGEMLQGESSGTAELPTSSSEIPPLHDNLQHTNFYPPEDMLHASGESSGSSSTTLGAPRLQNDLPPAPETPGEDVNLWRWYYDSRVFQPPSSSSEYNSEVALPVYAPPPAPEPEALEPEASEPEISDHEVSEPEVPEPEVDTFFNDARKQKLKTIAKYGAVAGGSVIFTLALQKVINGLKNTTYVSASSHPLLPSYKHSD